MLQRVLTYFVDARSYDVETLNGGTYDVETYDVET